VSRPRRAVLVDAETAHGRTPSPSRRTQERSDDAGAADLDLVLYPGGIVVVEVPDLPDGIAFAVLRRTLGELAGTGHPRLIVDMQRAADIPRSAIALLMETERVAREREGSLLVACSRGAARRMGIRDVLPTYPSRAAALHAMTHAAARGTVP
jgi:hypothetical protein